MRGDRVGEVGTGASKCVHMMVNEQVLQGRILQSWKSVGVETGVNSELTEIRRFAESYERGVL